MVNRYLALWRPGARGVCRCLGMAARGQVASVAAWDGPFGIKGLCLSCAGSRRLVPGEGPLLTEPNETTETTDA